MRNYNLYVILDRALLNGRDIIDAAKEFKAANCLIQYRDKISSKGEIRENAYKLRDLGIPLIINDHPDIAKGVGALGAHLGQDDMGIKDTRKMLGEESIIGKSTHSLAQAVQAEKEGADYIGIGPVFPTGTKKDASPIGLLVLKSVSKKIKIPAFAIGGITLNNLDSVLSSGIKRVAVASAIICSDSMKGAAKDFYNRLKYEPDRVCA